jgi:hypothetical protein
MPDLDDFDDFDDDQQSGPKALRDQLKKEQAARKKLEADLAEIKARAEKAEQAAKRQTLAELFKEAGVPRAARWAEKDGIEPTKEAVAAWLKENAEDFAPPAPKPTPTPQTDGDGQQDDQQVDPDGSMDPNLLALLEAEGNLGAQSGSPGARTQMQRIEALDPTKFGSFEEYVAGLNKELTS